MARLAVPTTERYFSTLTPADARVFDALDREALEEEKSRVAPWVAEKLTTPTLGVKRRLAIWETLGVRMREGWPPDGTYFVDEYVNDLDTRDALEELAEGLPEGAGRGFRAVLGELDEVFEALTEEDGGASLAWRLDEAEGEAPLRAWWWHRAPADAPWAPEPSAEADPER
ncbi:hypothetical protein [Streptomyces fuscigenes]|uniref:hypothetical protein n=1 Tax=Streptomyces fuscigenes TaxID=1528880 RepID=UPI001F174555|nr:hypothetical protein [Streptomyces fuscigenes]MCF3961076.1 hypothetical protein [Streptomyces fuscigenes]